MASIYPDSKTFVDMKMKKTPNETLAAFNDFMEQKKEAPTTAEIKEWVETMFEKPGAEFEEWIPDDWIESPRFLQNIKDLDLRDFAKKLNGVWHQLGRKMIADVGVSCFCDGNDLRTGYMAFVTRYRSIQNSIPSFTLTIR